MIPVGAHLHLSFAEKLNLNATKVETSGRWKLMSWVDDARGGSNQSNLFSDLSFLQHHQEASQVLLQLSAHFCSTKRFKTCRIHDDILSSFTPIKNPHFERESLGVRRLHSGLLFTFNA
jgi:hypothetical protein